MSKRHECKYWRTFTHRRPHFRRCGFCGRTQYKLGDEWRDEMTLRQFAEKWLPAISGTDVKDMMTVKVAFPFEWRCYESWKACFSVRFDFTDVLGRREAGLGTRTDVMNGWRSKYAEAWVEIDHEAQDYYLARTGQPYVIGDNCYGAMREVIQR